jgi:hypothetical protein
MIVHAALVALALVAAPRRAVLPVTAAVTGVLVIGPAASLAAGGAMGAVAWRRRLSLHRSEAEQAEADVTLLAELVLLGIRAGLTFTAALEMGAVEVSPALRREVTMVVRRARLHSAAAVLEHAGGLARRLYAAAGRASLTGAPVADAVAAFVAERRDEERARRRAAAARLPVRMLVPLSLLILPGFVLLTVGPALLGAVRRLGLLGP